MSNEVAVIDLGKLADNLAQIVDAVNVVSGELIEDAGKGFSRSKRAKALARAKRLTDTLPALQALHDYLLCSVKVMGEHDGPISGAPAIQDLRQVVRRIADIKDHTDAPTK